MKGLISTIKVDGKCLSVFIAAHRQAKSAMIERGLSPRALSEELQRAAGSLNHYIQGTADLSGQDLRTFPLADVDLSGADLTACILSNMVLWNTNFEHAVLDCARMDGTELTWANMNHAHMAGAVLQGALLDKTQLQHAIMPCSRLTSAQLLETNLYGAFLPESNMQSAVFERADLRDTNLSNCLLEGAEFRNSLLDGAIVTGSILDPASTISDISPEQDEHPLMLSHFFVQPVQRTYKISNK